MEKKVLEKKWKAVLPKSSNGYWLVMCGDTEICTVFCTDEESRAKRIVKDHNEMLKLKKQIKS